jgi:hypothetical protein
MKEERLWIDGKPVFWIPPEARSRGLKKDIALFSLEVLKELRKTGPDTPLDILSVGDNWTLLLTSREPKDTHEKTLKTLYPDLIFTYMWPLDERPEGAIFPELHKDIWSKVVEGYLEDRILDKYAVLDRASVAYPIFDEDEIKVLEERSWGRIVRPLSREPLIVYHLQRF